MKLRILGNSLRLRLSKPELDQLAVNGAVSQQVEFGTGSQKAMTYSLVRSDAEMGVTASYKDGSIMISAPAGTLNDWINSDEIGFRGKQETVAGEPLKILVEKDFACRKPRPGEDDSDKFANPSTSVAC